MSDLAARTLERAGDPLAFAAQWRRGLEPVPRVVCACRDLQNAAWDVSCSDCSGRGTVPLPDPKRLRLLAYVGHAGARRLQGHWDPRKRDLLDFIAPLPPFLRTACALGAARLVLPGWEEENACPHGGYHAGDPVYTGPDAAPRLALDACAAWLRDPTAEREEAWHKAHRLAWPGGEGIDMFVLSPVGLENGWVAARIQTCARLHGDTPAVHEAARAQAEALLLHGEDME